MIVKFIWVGGVAVKFAKALQHSYANKVIRKVKICKFPKEKRSRFSSVFIHARKQCAFFYSFPGELMSIKIQKTGIDRCRKN